MEVLIRRKHLRSYHLLNHVIILVVKKVLHNWPMSIFCKLVTNEAYQDSLVLWCLSLSTKLFSQEWTCLHERHYHHASPQPSQPQLSALHVTNSTFAVAVTVTSSCCHLILSASIEVGIHRLSCSRTKKRFETPTSGERVIAIIAVLSDHSRAWAFQLLKNIDRFAQSGVSSYFWSYWAFPQKS